MRGVDYPEHAEDDGLCDRIFSTRKLTARKPHACDGCPEGSCIRPGEQYTQTVGVNYETGEFYVQRSCDATTSPCWDRYHAELKAEDTRRVAAGLKPYDPAEEVPF